MPKLKNVTAEDVKSLMDRAEILLADLHDVTDRMEKGYVDPQDKPISLARTFNALTRASSAFVTQLLVQFTIDEQKRELEALYQARADQAAND